MEKNNDIVSKTLREIDFSSESPGHKERLLQMFLGNSRELTEEELDFVAAAGSPDAIVRRGM